MNDVSSNNHVRLLWTGGWDSTFQLLRLLNIDKCSVTPYYLIDPDRPSTGLEIRALSRIKKRILKDYPHTQELFQTVQYFSVDDIAADAEISNAFYSITKKKHLGSQYEWLARFCKERGITDMQLSVEAKPGHSKVNFDFEELVCEQTDNDQLKQSKTSGSKSSDLKSSYSKSKFRVDPKFKMMQENTLFQYFSFPTIQLTKGQMAEIVTQQDWKKIMKMTWFCHNPTKRIQPCGKCTPCLLVIDAGLGWRIPTNRRFFSFFYRYLVLPFKRPVKMMLRKLTDFKQA